MISKSKRQTKIIQDEINANTSTIVSAVLARHYKKNGVWVETRQSKREIPDEPEPEKPKRKNAIMYKSYILYS